MSATLVVSDEPARKVLVGLIRPHLSKRWVLFDDERPGVDDARPRVRIVQRSVEPGGTGTRAQHRVTFRVTVTVPADSLQEAEDALDDDLSAVLHAFDAAGILWGKADKSVFADENNRLGYSFDLSLLTNPTPNPTPAPATEPATTESE